jgi:D-cysteine desulfhydrase
VLRGTRLALGRYPTPVERIEVASGSGSGRVRLWVKRDDRTSDVYGGNKVRKLELLLGAARDAGKARVLTVGAVGSHQVVATAIYGAREGFAVEAVLVPQPASPHAELNLRVALAYGLEATACPAWSLAAHELAAQVRAGELAEPDVVVVAMGSGGTAAGLAVGFEQAGLRTRVLGVAVAPPTPVLRHMARRLAQKTAALAGLPVAAGLRAAKRIDVDGKWIGRGYGYATAEGRAATEVAARAGLTLDATYTAKAFARAREESAAREVLYWHTLSTAPLEPLLAERGEPGELPEKLRKLLR